MRELIAALNAEQRAAVEATEGPVLVLAGAGTGKTRVVTVRIAHLLQRRVDPRNVLAMTFTNKAAAEMRDRVAQLVGKKRAKELTIGTFHSFCVRALRKNARAAGLPSNFTICDASDQITALKAALRELRVPETKMRASALQARISLLKNRCIEQSAFLDGAGDDTEELIGRAWRRYEDQLARARTVDFDDLLLRTVRLLRDDAEVRARFRECFRYVMVDEYQDTNAPQYEIVHGIAGGHENLCVVGDDDQSIYGWRGADVTKILNFERDFPRAKVVRLETNYRSTVPILEAANRVIAHNPARHEKALRSAYGEGEQVVVRRLRDETEEATYVVKDIMRHVREGRAALADCAILFRTQIQPRAFEAELRSRAVPYVLVGGPSFFDRKEVRDVLAYLKLLANPDDEVAFLRVIDRPSRGIGRTSIEKLVKHATTRGVSVPHLLASSEPLDGVQPAALDAARSFRSTLARLGANEPGANLVRCIRDVLEVVGYRTEVDRSYDDPRQREDRWNAVGEVMNFAENHVRRASEPSLGAFLEELALTATDAFGDESPKKREAVTLMTLHAAKGLEFPRVYLVGCEEGLLPHARSVEEDTVEEERRLMYVGITRARRVLQVTYTAERARYGSRAVSMPSRFLYEMRGETPPEGWVPAGSLKPANKKAAKKAAKKKSTRKKAPARRPRPPR